MEEQRQLFEIVKAKIPDGLVLANEIEELLGLSRKSVYRRIRGETPIVPFLPAKYGQSIPLIQQ